MKNVSFIILILLINVFNIYALSPEKQILGTWEYNMSALIPQESVKENNTQALITFMNGDSGKGKGKDGWLQIKMNVTLNNFDGLPAKYKSYNKKVSLSFEVTQQINFKWHIVGNKLVSTVTSNKKYYNDFKFSPNLPISEQYYEELTHYYDKIGETPSYEEQKGIELMINSPINFSENGDLILVYDNTNLVKDFGEEPYITQFSNKRYATLEYDNPNGVENPYNFRYTENGYTYDPNDTGFLYLYIWNENGNILNNTDNLSGTYYCMAENEGIWSNITEIHVGSLYLEAKCFEAENEQQKRIVIKSTDAKIETNRYKKLGENHYRIMVGDKVEFKLTDNGTDITNQVQLKTTQGDKISRIHHFNTSGAYKIYAQMGSNMTNYATIEVMDKLYFDINPNTIIHGYGAKCYAYHYNSKMQSKTEPLNVTIRNNDGRVIGKNNISYRLSKLGTNTFFAATDKVRSDDKTVSVEPTILKLSADRYYSNSLNRYLMYKNNSVKFNVNQNNIDVTSKQFITIFDQNNKEVPIIKYIGAPGIYRYIATNNFTTSNHIEVESRGRLWICAKNATNRDNKDKGFADIELNAEQDKKDVTELCVFHYKAPHSDWRTMGNGISSITVNGKGWHYFQAVRDEYYKSNISVIRVNDNKKEFPNQEIKIAVDKDTIHLGESIVFTTTPKEANVFEDDDKVDKVHTPKTEGLHIFHARKGNLFSEPLSVYVKSSNSQKNETPTEEEKQPNDTSESLTISVNRQIIELGQELKFNVTYNGQDCTSKATIKCETTDSIVGPTHLPNNIGQHQFTASLNDLTSNSIFVNVIKNGWVGTYQVTSPHKIEYDNMGKAQVIDAPETFEISIDYNDGYRIYGLSKNNPQCGIIATEIKTNYLSLTPSHLTDNSADSITKLQPNWVFIMHQNNTDTLKYYTKPVFATPLVIAKNKAGRIFFLQPDMVLPSGIGNFISVDIFNIDQSKGIVQHRSPVQPIEYRAGCFTDIQKISSEVKHFNKVTDDIMPNPILTQEPKQEIDDNLKLIDIVY